jgi:hypothetical protein
MRVTRDLPENYRGQGSLTPTKDWKGVVVLMFLSIITIFTVGRLVLQFTKVNRPSAYESLGFHDLYDASSGYTVTITSRFLLDMVLALVLVLFIHETVHGLLYWRFTGRSPAFGFKGIFVYVNASSEFYFPRNKYLVVGLGPILLLTPIGLTLIVVLPEALVQILIFFFTFNAAGAVGDLYMVARLLCYSNKTYLQDFGEDLIIYGLS